MEQTTNTNKNEEKKKDKYLPNDINLKAQLFRIQTLSCLKEISNIWQLDETKICQFFERYQSLPQSKINASGLFEMKGTRMIRNENKIFLGQVGNKKKNGSGIVIYRDGHIYQGQFSENQKCGYGCELYSNGNLYIGSFWQNKKHGKGSFFWFNLCAPACTKDAGMNIEQYHGDWWGGLPDGVGQHQKSCGDYYVGGFKNGLKHGSGIEYYSNQDVYKGEFLNGLGEGYGQYNSLDGSTFKGNFKQGYRNGYGIWISKDGKQQYIGHFFLDRKHGYGVYDWGNGTVYRGNYLQDVRLGYAELYKNGQKVYEGEWQDSQLAKLKYDRSPARKKKSHSSKIDLSSTGTTTGGLNFRIKQSKHFHKSAGTKLQGILSRTNKDSILFKFIDCKPSTHRNCFACKKLVFLESIDKLKKSKEKYANPQQLS